MTDIRNYVAIDSDAERGSTIAASLVDEELTPTKMLCPDKKDIE